MLVEELQIDITTYCNSHCGGCIRNNDGGEACVELVHLSPKIFQKINFDDVKVVYFNGAYGDFTMHPYALDIIDSIPNHVTFDASTNGGARDKAWWSDLSKILKKFKSSRVTFAIDGIHTNHVYRRGVNINRVLENAQSFIRSGGNARWKYIVFEHNAFELEEASIRARAMGFTKFVVNESYLPEIYQKQYKDFKECTVKRTSVDRRYEWCVKEFWYPEEPNDDARCKWRKRRAAQIDAWGNIWQCCYMPSVATHPEMYKELTLFDLDNNLHKYSYDEILHGSFFSELFYEPIDLCKNCKDYV